MCVERKSKFADPLIKRNKEKNMTIVYTGNKFKKNKSVAYSSQGNHTRQLDICIQ